MSEVEQILKTELNEDQQDLLAAMLAAVARADGRVDAHEVAFLKSFLGDRIQEGADGSLETPPLPADDEIGRRGAVVANPLYLACSLLMCADEEADESEQLLLRRFGDALALEMGRRAKLDLLARTAILDQAAFAMSAFEEEGVDKVSALKQLARKVGATGEEAEALCQKHGFGQGS